jgi:hypothetical protein
VSDFVPDLDDIAFDQLVEQARAAIPRYAPAWTDHNLHDPGMTLIDLLAWIVDQQVYRAGSVGGRYQAAFAALLGRHPSDPVAAAGLVWPDGPLPDGRLIPARTAAVCLTHRELSFEVDHEQLYLPAVTLTGLRDEHGTDVPLDGGSWTAGPEFSLVFDGPLSAGTPTGTTTRVSLGFDVVPPSGAAVTGDDPPWGPVRYLYQAGDSGWRDVCVLRDDTYGLAATGVVELAIPRRPAGPGGSELRLSLRRGFYPLRPQIRGVAVNVLRVRQIGRTAKEQYAPDGGRPDRLIPLDATGLVEPVTITVDGVPWERRADLSRSGPADGHFLVRPDGIQFGNGVNGKIPPVKVVVERGPLARTEGTAGNLRSGLRWTVPVLKIDVYGRNRQAVSGGPPGRRRPRRGGPAVGAAHRRRTGHGRVWAARPPGAAGRGDRRLRSPAARPAGGGRAHAGRRLDRAGRDRHPARTAPGAGGAAGRRGAGGGDGRPGPVAHRRAGVGRRAETGDGTPPGPAVARPRGARA